MPTAAELPASRAPWTVDPARALLLVHDMQNHFLRPFPRDTAPLTDLLANIGALREACAAAGVPVVFSAQPGGQSPDQRGLQWEMWGAGIGPAPADSAIVDALAPGPGDTVMTKWRYNAFHRTDLADLLAASGRDQVVVTGVYAHIGCLVTATEAFCRDVQAFLVADAVADFSREEHDQALDYAAGRCAVVADTATVAGWLGRG
ncbi:isochorismatase family protein [Actinokineospora pegani]|uniref:isochorismatase family protein n=1 Tax=Actinokineospora pegani TaxID=2654637 RepID=UPI0012EA3DD4